MVSKKWAVFAFRTAARMRQPSLASARTMCRPRKPEPPNIVTSLSEGIAVIRCGPKVICACVVLSSNPRDRVEERLRISRFALTVRGAAPKHPTPRAQMAELVDALVSGTSAARRGGSSPLLGTNLRRAAETVEALRLPVGKPPPQRRKRRHENQTAPK